MPATMIRATVRGAIVTLLRTATATAGIDGKQLQVERGWPGALLEAESIWLDASEGEQEIAVFRGPVSPANPLARDDRFTVPIQVAAGLEGQTFDEAEARVLVLFGYVETLFATNPNLGGLDGLIGGAVLGEVNGPATGHFSEGVKSFMRGVVNCHSRESA